MKDHRKLEENKRLIEIMERIAFKSNINEFQYCKNLIFNWSALTQELVKVKNIEIDLATFVYGHNNLYDYAKLENLMSKQLFGRNFNDITDKILGFKDQFLEQI